MKNVKEKDSNVKEVSLMGVKVAIQKNDGKFKRIYFRDCYGKINSDGVLLIVGKESSTDLPIAGFNKGYWHCCTPYYNNHKLSKNSKILPPENCEKGYKIFVMEAKRSVGYDIFDCYTVTSYDTLDCYPIVDNSSQLFFKQREEISTSYYNEDGFWNNILYAFDKTAWEYFIIGCDY